MNPVELHRKSVDSVSRIIENLKPEHMSQPTNLKWNVKELLNHVIGFQYMAPTILGSGSMSEGDHDQAGEKDFAGDDPMKAWKESTDMANKALAEADMEKIVHLPFGDMPGMAFGNILASEVLIHAWDIAHSTKQDDTLDPHLVEVFYSYYEPQRQMLRESGAFGEGEVEVAQDADLQIKLLALLGRKR